MNIRPYTRKLVLLAVFTAIIVALGYPGSPLNMIGFPSIGGVINATTLHIPVIIGAVLEGPVFGAILGAVMGLMSLLKAALQPNATSPYFILPWVSILPRILIGLASAGVFSLAKKKLNRSISAGFAAAAGTLTNTIVVVTMLTFCNAIGSVDSAAWDAIRSVVQVIISISGACELGLAIVLVVAVEKALRPWVTNGEKRNKADGQSSEPFKTEEKH